MRITLLACEKICVIIFCGFIFSGGIATISNVQSLYDFLNVFIWYTITAYMVMDFYFIIVKEKEKEK